MLPEAAARGDKHDHARLRLVTLLLPPVARVSPQPGCFLEGWLQMWSSTEGAKGEPG